MMVIMMGVMHGGRRGGGGGGGHEEWSWQKVVRCNVRGRLSMRVWMAMLPGGRRRRTAVVRGWDGEVLGKRCDGHCVKFWLGFGVVSGE